MKLIFCPKCTDVVRLVSELRRCQCGFISGRYTDSINAEISKEAVPLGFDNPSLAQALKNQPPNGLGRRFEAFVIPKECPSIQRLDKRE